MKRILLLGVCVALMMPVLLAQPTIKDENVEMRPVGSFSGIEVSGGFDVYITQGSEESVAVSASRVEYRKYIVVEVKGSKLHIYFKPPARQWSVRNLRLRAYISYKTLESLQLSGATDARLVDAWKAAKARVEVSGASDLRGSVEFDEAKMDLSGASDISISGRVGKLKLDASGASKFAGYDLYADVCDAQASGASDIKVTARRELYVQASGASDIYYKGDASVREIRTSGASSVKKR